MNRISTILRQRLLGAALVIPFLASPTFAQSDEPPTQQDHPTTDNDHPHGDHSSGHVGVGFQINLGDLFGGPKKPKPKDTASNVDQGKLADEAPPVLADALPTAPTGDPKGGIPVSGGTVHRGTGTYTNPKDPKDKRPAFYLWFERAANSDCKACDWFQFIKTDVTLEGHDVTGTLGKDGPITSSIGSETIFGKWSGDWHKNDEKERAKDKKLPKLPHVNLPGSKPPVDAGPYTPVPIPGAGGAEGLIDAPNWGATEAWKQLVKRLSDRKIIHTHATGDQPPDSSFTMVVTSSFRDYLYCVDPPPPKCIGHSDETYVETLKFKITWHESTNIEMGGASNKGWDADVTLDTDTSTVTLADWKGCK